MDNPEKSVVADLEAPYLKDPKDTQGQTAPDVYERYRRVVELDLPNPPGPGGTF